MNGSKGLFVLPAHWSAPGYDNIHVELLKNLGPKALTWLSKFFYRIMATHSVLKIWRKAKVIASKDPSLAANYHPVSLLEHLALQRISPTVEGLLSPDRAGFQNGRNTCDQVAALTTFIENGFQQNLKTAPSSWTSGTLVFFTNLVKACHIGSHDWWVLLRDRRFRVHIGNDISSWRPQRNSLPQGSVFAPVLFNLYATTCQLHVAENSFTLKT